MRIMARSVADGDSGEPERRTAEYCAAAQNSALLLPAGGAYVPPVFVGMYVTQGRYNVRVYKLKHYYGLDHLHYLTTRTYRRAHRSDSERLAG
ncbi:MAG: hypothetical protein ABSF14_13660 [Terriglobia bacterium]|jgi:hypothetical protein